MSILLRDQVGFGGSCHWCTEAIFRSLRGVTQVEQGWISPSSEPEAFAEAVVVHFDPAVISVETLIEVHLHTHSCTSVHSMRSKYRSAVYTYHAQQAQAAGAAIRGFQKDFPSPIITQVLEFGAFRLNKQEYLDYYYSNPDKPFCKVYIDPKLRILLDRFAEVVDQK
ncbi:peptide-methionine (S)-S-oxide reductase [Dyadobacter sandarakinus]|uniref:peptide-methionine (S)-S-oxide reductase n=1 Tax=Dyadobacter sandarakinus TaxID=2747268 RepID=A0ABX7I2Y9_9BACT|nr:peptide-methionine (S)-S-oxide reductase [Dyadobacter sandarakinus]QRR00240.1 peptide-methionine (S)-S-oxide reductase [Dyadobacter sandarakinus]